MLSIIDSLKQFKALQYFTVYLRFLIGGVFIIASIGLFQMEGSSFLSNLGSNESQKSIPSFLSFIKGVFETGLYWQLFGVMQLVAGILLLTQKYAKVGAIFFFGLMLNIALLTQLYNLSGTFFVTSFMLLATFYLLVWDARSIHAIFVKNNERILEELPIANHIYWIVLGGLIVVSTLILSALKVTLSTTLLFFCAEMLLGSITFYFLRNRGHLQKIEIRS